MACVGDSITHGARLQDRENDSYPAQLQKLLGDNYVVDNYGISSCTLLRKASPSVWSQLVAIKAANPDIVIISLGTNDTCGMGTCGYRRCWEFKDDFADDYIALIDTIQSWSPSPQIWLCAPTPMVLETPGLSQERIDGLSIRKPRLQYLINIIKEVASKKKTGFVDLNTPMDQKPELFTENDGVYPNKDGYQTIAQLIYKEIK